ncbi:MAG: polyphosphate kinase [Vicingaceae bacterium]|jgi:polyphosphate kinase
MSNKNYVFHDREISWLSFNERVLQEAEDKSVPILERLKFLGIFSNNLDEFFRVRVPIVQKMLDLSQKEKEMLDYDPAETFLTISSRNAEMQIRFEEAYLTVKDELEKERIFFLNEEELDENQMIKVKDYFHSTVQPALVPIMLSEDRDLPELNGKAAYLVIKLCKIEEDVEQEVKYALIEIPTAIVSRFFVLNEEDGTKNVVLLDDVIRTCLPEIFAIFHYNHIEAFTIKITRDAELDIEDDVTTGFIEKLTEGLKNRKKGDPVRMIYDAEMDTDLLRFMIKKVGLEDDDLLVPGGRYHNFKDYMNFPKIGSSALRYKSMPPLAHPILKGKVSVFEQIKKQDILLSYPYQSYSHVIDLMREAAIDPAVTSIKITIYRLVSKNSKVIHSLINAARNGKSVTVVMELKARFDEESNMNYTDQLQDEGVRVIFGAAGLKVHTKLLVIKRKEDGVSVRYCHIGTGNFHENTARVYCDHSLLTCREEISDEVNKIFKFFRDNYKRYQFKHLIVAPFNARRRFMKFIDNEMKNAKDGKEAYVIIKVNNLHDQKMAKKIYEASRAGVKIKIIARSVNSVVNGVAGMSENIEAISIVDRLLEHARVVVFCNGGEEKVYIGSSDWMRRNLDRRVEVMTPILDENIKKMLLNVLALQLADNTKARKWNSDLSNEYVRREGDEVVRSQYAIYDYFSNQLIKADAKK